jgi:acetyl-CoA carboxylase carboxyl transferase subunit beta
MAWFRRRRTDAPRRVRPDGVFTKCEGCGATIVAKDIEDRLGVCRECNYHFRLSARRRIEITLDPGSFTEMFGDIESSDPLGFSAQRSYGDRLAEARERTGLSEAAVTGTGAIEGRPVALGVTDFVFMRGSMGSVVGERLTRLVEHATAEGLPLVIFCGSGGGARMDEGLLSLMQMAKTSAALARHAAACLPYLSVITNSSYGGTMASFASLGDIILAEPRALMGFTGPRVIEQTLKITLPKGFQEAEFMLEHGLVDRIVERKDMRAMLARLIDYCMAAREAGQPAGAA